MVRDGLAQPAASPSPPHHERHDGFARPAASPSPPHHERHDGFAQPAASPSPPHHERHDGFARPVGFTKRHDGLPSLSRPRSPRTGIEAWARCARCSRPCCSPPARGGTATAGDALPVAPAQLEAGYWIAKLPDAERVVLDAEAIAASQCRAAAAGTELARPRRPARRAGSRCGTRMDRKTVRAADACAVCRRRPCADCGRTRITVESLALDAIPDRVPVNFALVVHRAALRTFPSTQRVFSKPGDVDIDRFQESRAVPGHAGGGAARQPRRPLALRRRAELRGVDPGRRLAEGARGDVLGYAERQPQLVVTGGGARTRSIRRARRCRNCRWTWARICRCSPTGRAMKPSPDRRPTRRGWCSCRCAMRTVGCNWFPP